MNQKNDKESKLMSALILSVQLLAVCMLVFILGVSTMPYKEKSSEEDIKPIADLAKEIVAPMVVQAIKMDENKVGTGFYLKFGQKVVILTNKHVCQHSEKNENEIEIKGKQIRFNNQIETIIAIDSVHDLCLVTASNMHLGLSLEKLENPADQLDIIFTVGFPRGLDKDIKYGRNLGYDGKNGYTNMRTHGGESGSPVLNTSGKVVGVIWGRELDSESHGLFVPLEFIYDFVGHELYGFKRKFQ